MVLTVLPGMESYAAEEGETSAAASGLQDENSQRLEETTAIDEDGTIYEISGTDGTVGEDTSDEMAETAETEENTADNGIALFSARSASAVSLKVVNFNTKGNDVTYYNGKEGYTNGAYGADAAYLGTDSSGNIRFMLSGETGTVSASEVELVDYSSVADNVSYYTVSGGKLIHKISQNLNKAPASSVNNGPAPDYLSEGGKYYSYDGHYFYTDYSVMLYVYLFGSVGASAVNAGNAFYNYFQFLDMNSSTSYSGEELEAILQAAMKNAGKDSSSSKLTGTGAIFVKYQNTYSVNALLSLGIAINESAWGTSSICKSKNNLFGLNAVDSSPGQSANYFASVDDCIREFMATHMAGGYLKDGNWKNYGEYLGNKDSGINVKYASDPYWGEKAAALAWSLDTAGGSKDYLGTGSGDSVGDKTDSSAGNNNNTAGDNTQTGNEAGTAGDNTQTGNEAGTAGDNTQTGNEAGTAGDNTQTGNDAGTAGDNTQTGNEAGTAGDNTQTGNEAGTAGDNTQTGNDAGTAGDNTQTGNDAGTAGDNTQTGNETGTAGDDGQTDDKEDEETSDTLKPSVELKPSVSVQGSLNNPTVQVSQESEGSGQTSEASAGYAQKELSSPGEGIKISGELSDDASLTVKNLEPNTKEYTTYVSAEPVKGKLILGVYDITLSGSINGQVQLTFQVSSEYNGKNVVILHYLDDGSYETYRGTVENGQVTVSVKGFSPYVIALDEAGSGSTADRAPQTGDTGNPGVWIALLGMSGFLGLAVLLKRRTVKL